MEAEWATAAVERVGAELDVWLLPPLAYTKSNEHAWSAGTIWLSATTLLAVLDDIGRALDAGVDPPQVREDEHVALVSGDGYELLVRSGPAPAEGDDVQLDDGPYRCARTTRSPYPGDDRTCAVLERLPPVD